MRGDGCGEDGVEGRDEKQGGGEVENAQLQRVVEAAAVYLDAPVTKAVHVPSGLGSRHVAAAAATAQTNSIAIVISESSGTVTVFSKGSKVLSLG